MVDEPGGEKEEGATAAGALPEGADVAAGRAAADPAPGVRVQAPRAGRKSTPNLDLQVEIDEPTELIEELVHLAGERQSNDDWAIILEGALEIQKQLKAAQAPKRR